MKDTTLFFVYGQCSRFCLFNCERCVAEMLRKYDVKINYDENEINLSNMVNVMPIIYNILNVI